MMFRTLPVFALALLGTSTLGCAVRGRAGVYVEPMVVVSGPELVVVEPAPAVVVFREPPPLVFVEEDVYVVQNAGLAIYFVDGFYWHFGSGVWYQSSRWDDPWVTVDVHIVPPRIARRDHSHYVRFRGEAHARVWRQPKVRPRDNDRDRRPERNQPDLKAAPIRRPDADNVRPKDDDRARQKVDDDRARQKVEDAARPRPKDGDRDRPDADGDKNRPKDVDRVKPRDADPPSADDKKKKLLKKKKVDDKKKKLPKKVRPGQRVSEASVEPEPTGDAP